MGFNINDVITIVVAGGLKGDKVSTNNGAYQMYSLDVDNINIEGNVDAVTVTKGEHGNNGVKDMYTNSYYAAIVDDYLADSDNQMILEALTTGEQNDSKRLRSEIVEAQVVAGEEEDEDLSNDLPDGYTTEVYYIGQADPGDKSQNNLYVLDLVESEGKHVPAGAKYSDYIFEGYTAQQVQNLGSSASLIVYNHLVKNNIALPEGSDKNGFIDPETNKRTSWVNFKASEDCSFGVVVYATYRAIEYEVKPDPVEPETSIPDDGDDGGSDEQQGTNTGEEVSGTQGGFGDNTGGGTDDNTGGGTGEDNCDVLVDPPETEGDENRNEDGTW